jgi:AcrR family transcriptional regulator/ribosomal protein S18 acetylase RimI-like enzyme
MHAGKGADEAAARGRDMSQAPREGGQALQQERRRALIDATMTAIAEQGFSGLTLARVAALAGLSAGIVNFYFQSKEALLLETLKSVAEEFEQTVYAALDEAPAGAAAQLRAMLLASLAPAITEPRKVSVWYAFMSEAPGRRDYQEICGHRDQRYFARIHALCTEIIAQAGPTPAALSASALAHALSGLVDEFWQGVLFAGAGFDREAARTQCLAFLASVFPWAYTMPPDPSAAAAPASLPGFSIRRAVSEDVPVLARLFDLYRQFYRQPADRSGAERFLGERLGAGESVVFLAEDARGRAIGFIQLYPAICSVAMERYWVLYDLFVERSARGEGVGRALMERAREHAASTGAIRIDLETAVDNTGAQRLYESLGYVREQAFFKYSLALGP